jgi:hypothetical protein
LSFAHVKISRTKYIGCGNGTIHAEGIHFPDYVTYRSRNMCYYIILHCLDSTTIRTTGRNSCPRLSYISRTYGISEDFILSLSSRICTYKTPPLMHPTPSFYPLPCQIQILQASQPIPLHPRLLERYTTHPPTLQASIASEQADFACYCGALWIQHLWRKHYEMCNRCIVMCPPSSGVLDN